MTGLDNIPKLISNKAKVLAGQLVPAILQIALQAGIENLGSPNVKYPDTCLPSSESQRLLRLRNNLLTTLNATAKTIETLTLPLNTLNTAINITSTTLSTVSVARLAANVALAALPPPTVPGTLPSTINSLKDLEQPLNYKLTTTKNTAFAISVALDFVHKILVQLIKLLKELDVYFKKCVPDAGLVSINDYLTKVEAAATEVATNSENRTIYQGFVLEIVEEPFSPTINKRKAVAKNNNGIILLQTPLSFTTNSQALLEELKLIIDKSNLKAN
jgi:hypothetical protein